MEEYIVVGDFNGRVGSDFNNEDEVMEKFCKSTKNSNATKIINFGKMNETIIGHFCKYNRAATGNKNRLLLSKWSYEIDSNHYLVEIRL